MVSESRRRQVSQTFRPKRELGVGNWENPQNIYFIFRRYFSLIFHISIKKYILGHRVCVKWTVCVYVSVECVFVRTKSQL